MPFDSEIMTRSGLILRPNPARTVLRPFDLRDPTEFERQHRSRAQRIADRVVAMDEATCEREARRVREALAERHINAEKLVSRRFSDVSTEVGCGHIDRARALLIGAYFLQEYSFESAALFNPSMVEHDDQSELPEGAIRFVLSLRGIGEGHLSSVTFRVGTWSAAEGFAIDEPSAISVAPRIESTGQASSSVRIICEDSRDLSESMLFPVTPAQVRGIEDLRLVRFTDHDGTKRKLGTYTAFGDDGVRSELVEAHEYNIFDLTEMTGSATRSKGMALFPRPIGGRYMMLGRQDNESIWLIESDSLTHWEGGRKIIAPEYFWEYVQIGNCGSPIEIDEGWLVLTHGVGSVRNYCIGAVLLDRDDPTRILGRRSLPLIHPSSKERDGYVPNVVYSCGGMVHDRTLLLPYGVADNFTAFAHVELDDLLGTLE